MKGSSEAHTRLVEDVLIEIGGLPFVRCWKQHSGAARSFDNPDRVISFGLAGLGDISGILMGGIRLEIECKTGEAVQKKDQKNFEAMIKKFGGHYFVVRSKEEALKLVTEAAKGLQACPE